MKGVSEIIAMILIVMIVIAIVALAYTWFSGMFASLTETTSTATTTTSNMLTDFSVENADQVADENITVDIRNVGVVTINASQIATYINDVLYTNNAGTSCPINGLSAGIVCQFNVTGITTSVCGSRLMISVGTGFEEYETIDC